MSPLYLLAADAAAMTLALLAARRCATCRRLQWFWRLIAAACAAQLIADAITATDPPFPSWADVGYLACYGLLFAALVHIPVHRATRSQRVRMLIDGATVVVGGGAVVWYFLLGPTVIAGIQRPLADAVSIAYPLCDLVLLAGLSALLLRHTPATLRAPLLLIAAGVVSAVVADTIYGTGLLHGTYSNGDPVDWLYVVQFALFALAAASQRPLDPGELAASEADRRPSVGAAWLPYGALALGFGLVIAVEAGDTFFPDFTLLLIVIVLAALVATRQWLVQRELLCVQAALRQSERLLSEDVERRRAAERLKDELVSVVGHELRTPLTSIRGALGLLAAGVLGELPADARELTDVAIANTDRLTRLVNDTLDVERMEAGRLVLERAAFPAPELVAQALRAVQTAADEAVVVLDADVEPLLLDADGDRLVQALVNLLGNAIKFSPVHGVVTILVRRDGEDAHVSVHDDGRGIPAHQLETIFERFRQVDASDAREKKGTGLGLAIARGIAEAHGGRLWAESRLGEGATFHLTIPLAVPSGALADDRPPPLAALAEAT